MAIENTSKNELRISTLYNEHSTQKELNNLYLFTVNHKTAPVVIREKFAIPEYSLQDTVQNLKKFKVLESFLLLSTCNRTEIYFTTYSFNTASSAISKFFNDYFSIEEKITKEYSTFQTGSNVINHAFELTCGLDSLILGERQILSQVKSAYSLAQKEKTLDKILELLFQQSIKSAKEIHNKTSLSKSSQSISTAAVELADKICGPLKAKNILVLGAGLMAKLALEHIVKLGGAKETMALNRSPHRVIEFHDRYKVTKTIPFENVYEALNSADILICASGAPHFIIFANEFNTARSDPSKSLFIFDISMPRNVDQEFGRLKNVKLFDIDCLQEIYNKTRQPDKKDIIECNEIISNNKNNFYNEIKKEALSTVIKDLKERFEKIRQDKTTKLKGNKTSFSQDEIDFITKNITNTILHLPLTKLKNSDFDSIKEKINLIKELFEI